MTLEDRLDVLREIAGIEHDVILFEDQHGRTADGDDLRRRLTAARLLVLEQLLCCWLRDLPDTVH